jgi:DMSO reductase family type II enzyme heme b subunit
MKVAQLATEPAELTNPGSPAWGEVPAIEVSLKPVALAAQPVEYIRETWAGRPYGQTSRATVAAATARDRLYVRVEWEDDEAPNREFQDAAAVVFDGTGGDIATLGSAAHPVALWYWEHGRQAPLHLISRGPGVVSKDSTGAPTAAAVLAGKRWAVVFSGPAGGVGQRRIGVALWNGSNNERGGLAAVTPEWLPLESERGV